jgi:uncharacterized protein YegP (UPF0339 family)
MGTVESKPLAVSLHNSKTQMAKFIITRNIKGKFGYTLYTPTGDILLKGEGYGSKQGCMIGIHSVQFNAEDEYLYEIKKNKTGTQSFVLWSANGRLIGESPEYKRASDLEKAISYLQKKAAASKIEDATRRKKRLAKKV